MKAKSDDIDVVASVSPLDLFFQTSFYWEMRLFFFTKTVTDKLSCATGTRLSMGLTSQTDSKLSHP